MYNAFVLKQPVTNRSFLRRSPWTTLLGSAGAAIYLWLSVARITTPYLLGGDQVYFWTYAQRMLAGERAYRDFFQFTPVGTDLVFAGAFRLLGETAFATNLVVVLLGLISFWLCLSLSKKILPASGAWLASFLWLVLFYGKALNATHHWFSTLFAMGVVRLLLRDRRPPTLVAAGCLLGIASAFTQTRGLFGLLAVLLVFAFVPGFGGEREAKPRSFLGSSVWLVSGFVLVLAMTVSIFCSGAWRQAWFCQVIYPWTYVHGSTSLASILGLPGGPVSAHPLYVSRSLVLAVIAILPGPIVLGLSLRRCTGLTRDRIILLAAVGTVLMVEVMFRPNWLRIYSVAMPCVVLAVWLGGKLPPVSRRIVALGVWILILVNGAGQIVARYRANNVVVVLAMGRVQTTSEQAGELEWAKVHLKPGDPVFQSNWPRFYLPLGVRNPLYIDTFPEGPWPPELLTLTVSQLERSPPRFIILSSQPREVQATSPLQAWMGERYRCVQQFANGESAWEQIEREDMGNSSRVVSGSCSRSPP